MKLVKFTALILIITFGFFITPVSASANALDEECATFCKKNGHEDGHYLPQEPGAKCDEGYKQSEENQICCCGEIKE